MKTLNENEAKSFYNKKGYVDMTDKEKALLQLLQEKYLCMPIEIFMRAVNNVLGRRVEASELLVNKKEILVEILKDESPTLGKIEKKLQEFHYQ